MIFKGKAADNHSAAFFCVNFITLYKLLIINVSTVTGEFGRCDHANDHSQQFLSVICLYFMNFVFLLIKLYLLKGVIIWPCLKRTGNKQIRELDWLRSILTAV